MQERHQDRQLYFNEQKESTRFSVLPYITQYKPLQAGSRVLEIGCGEAGNLHPFLEIGCECYGVELSEVNFNNANKFYAQSPLKEHLHLLHANIYNIRPEDLAGTFDVVFLRDVIEHIPEQDKLMNHLKQFIATDGVLFIAFPPWRNPFGGHQQICRNKWLSKTPYLHLLSSKAYSKILNKGGEMQGAINELLDIKKTGLSINRFKRILKKENYQVIDKTHYLINPNYKIKFGLKPRKMWSFFRIPVIQDFYTTAVYYLLRK